MAESVRQALDWGQLAPLRLRARSISDGLYTGAHRSLRRGAGIEFGGHRDYLPGDDLRRLDYRALLRHGKLLVREFETETDRSVRMIVDRTGSMAYRSSQGPGAKLAYCAVLAAGLARVGIASGDPVSLDWLGRTNAPRVPAGGGRDAFERIVGALELVQADAPEELAEVHVMEQLLPVSRSAKRGSVIVLFSDLIDLPPEAPALVTGLAAQRRTVIVVQVLDPVEATFPFDGTVRLRALEGEALVETDASQSRSGYLRALQELQERWRAETVRRGGAFLTATTADAPVTILRRIVRAVSEAGR